MDTPVLYSISRILRFALVMMLGSSALARSPREVVPGMLAEEIISEHGEPKGKAIGDNGRENWLYPQFQIRLQDGAVVSVRYVNQTGGSVTLTTATSASPSTGWFTPAARPLGETQAAVSQLIPEASVSAPASSVPASPARTTVASAQGVPGGSGAPPVRRVLSSERVLPVAPPSETGDFHWDPKTFLTGVALACAILALVVRVGGRKRHHPYRGASPLPGSSAHSPLVKRPDLQRTGRK